jgi:hypothetical protein
MKSGKSAEKPLKKKSMIEDFESALSEHAGALKRKGRNVQTSDSRGVSSTVPALRRDELDVLTHTCPLS